MDDPRRDSGMPCISCRRPRMQAVVADYVVQYGGHAVILRQLPQLRCPCGLTRLEIPHPDDLHRVLAAFFADKGKPMDRYAFRIWVELYARTTPPPEHWRGEEQDGVLLVTRIGATP